MSALPMRRQATQAREFKYNAGIAEFINTSIAQAVAARQADLHGGRSGVVMEIGLQYNDGYSESVFSFANNINTVETGGALLSGFAWRDPHHQLCRTADGLVQDVKDNLTATTCAKAWWPVISVKMPQPHVRRSKPRQTELRYWGLWCSVHNERLGAFFEADTTVARKIINKAIDAARAREAARKACAT